MGNPANSLYLSEGAVSGLNPLSQPAPRQKPKEPLRNRIFRYAVPLWLMTTFFAPALDDSLRSLNQGGALALMFLAGIFLADRKFLFGAAFREDPLLSMLLVAFSAEAITSAFLSEDPFFSLGMFSAIIVGLLICAGLWEFVQSNILQALSTFCILGTTVVGITYVVTNQGSGRYMAIIHPNQWGSICFGLSVAALAIKKHPLKFAAIGVNVFVILQAQARGSFSALVVAFSVFALLRTIRSVRVAPVGVVIRILLLALSLLAILYYSEVVIDEISKIFHLYQAQRGLGSGFTGRTGFWEEALETFREHPILGVGPRMTPVAHNGYLIILSDVGLVGAILFFPVLILRTLRLWKQARKGGDMVASIGLALVSGYLFFAIFEGSLLNVGNPTSLLAWLFMFKPTMQRVDPAGRSRQPTFSTPVEARIGGR